MSGGVDADALVRRAHAKGRDATFAEVIVRAPEAEDDETADLIEADARLRIERGLKVELGRYLAAVPNLSDLPVSLDAAIEFALRALDGEARPGGEAVEALSDAYPQFRDAIADAAALGDAICSTEGLRTDFDRRPPLELPASVGPVLASGERRFELERVIGRGAQGVVYAAVDRRLSEPGHPASVAIKVLDREAEVGSDLVEEAARARRIDHRNVVRVIDADRLADDRVFIVYELVEGGDLDGLVRKGGGRLPAREAAALVAQVARGVQAAHSARVVHCDLKPGNVLLSGDGTPKIADFGVSVALDASAREGVEEPVGSLAFTSPEQFRCDDGAFSVPTDIFGLGGILYYVLTGELPNGSTREAITESLERGHDDRDRFDRLEAAFDRDLAAICCRALNHDPSERHASADALARDLDAWLRSEPIHWTDPTALWASRLALRRNRVAAALIGVGIVATLLLTGLLARQSAMGAGHELVEEGLRGQIYVLEQDLQRARLRILGLSLDTVLGAYEDGDYDVGIKDLDSVIPVAKGRELEFLRDLHFAFVTRRDLERGELDPAEMEGARRRLVEDGREWLAAGPGSRAAGVFAQTAQSIGQRMASTPSD